MDGVVRRWGKGTVLALALVFLVRLAYGLASEFWGEDEKQVYLLGLKWYSGAGWPWFGPDVVYTASQIPGALQSLLVGVPLKVLAVPEAPFILLNLLSFAALLLLAAYLLRLFPGLPVWPTVLWVLTCPWAMNYSAHVVNPSYVLFGSVLFFVGFLESTPAGTGWWGPEAAAAAMGFGLFWVMQLHLSWVLLVPMAGVAFLWSWSRDRRPPWRAMVFFVLGALPMLALLLPTYLRYGLVAGSGGTAENIRPVSGGWRAWVEVPLTVLARFVSFGTFEITRFMGPWTKERLEFLRDWWWSAPFTVFAGLLGAAHALWAMVALFRRVLGGRTAVLRGIVGAVVAMTAAAFLFSVKGPSSHAFYTLFPLAMVWAVASVEGLLRRKVWRTLFVGMVVSGLVTHLALGLRSFGERSLYRDRARVVAALRAKDWRILGERRRTASGIGY